MDKKIAEFIGIMLGDGSIGLYNCRAGNKIKKKYQLKVTLDSRNKDYIYYVVNLIREVFKIEPKVYFKKTENTADIHIFNKEIFYHVLENIGLKLSPKWGTMEIPKKYEDGELSNLVLRGLFDTDGSITIFNNNNTPYPRIEIRMSPCPAQQQIINILERNKFNFKVQNLERGKIKLRISGKEELKKWFEKIGSSNDLHIKRANLFLMP